MEQKYLHDYENEFDAPEYEYDFYDDYILEQMELEDLRKMEDIADTWIFDY